MSCIVPYVEERYRETNPELADALNKEYGRIWDRLHMLNENTDGTFNYPDSPAGLRVISEINEDYGGEVVENKNSLVNVNVLNATKIPTTREQVGKTHFSLDVEDLLVRDTGVLNTEVPITVESEDGEMMTTYLPLKSVQEEFVRRKQEIEKTLNCLNG